MHVSDLGAKSTIRFKVATLTRKNSSVLLENMPRNFTLCRSGTLGSPASCKTLPLNDSQLMSLAIVLRLIAVICPFNFVQFKG